MLLLLLLPVVFLGCYGLDGIVLFVLFTCCCFLTLTAELPLSAALGMTHTHIHTSLFVCSFVSACTNADWVCSNACNGVVHCCSCHLVATSRHQSPSAICELLAASTESQYTVLGCCCFYVLHYFWQRKFTSLAKAADELWYRPSFNARIGVSRDHYVARKSVAWSTVDANFLSHFCHISDMPLHRNVKTRHSSCLPNAPNVLLLVHGHQLQVEIVVH